MFIGEDFERFASKLNDFLANVLLVCDLFFLKDSLL